MKKWMVAALAVALCCGLFAACAGKQTAADESWKKVEEKGYFVLGFDDNFPPMGFKEGDKYTGFDIELAQAVGKKLNIDVRLQPIDWNSKELELKGGNIDVIWNGLSLTPEREENLLLSKPYMTNMQVMMVKQGSPIKTLDDLKDKKVAVQASSSAINAFKEAFADKQQTFDSIKRLEFKDNMTASLDVANGNADALAVDSVVADYIMAKSPGKYTILDETLTPEDFAIGFRKGDKAFNEKVDSAIDELIAEGTFSALSYKWFGKDVTHGKRGATSGSPAGN